MMLGKVYSRKSIQNLSIFSIKNTNCGYQKVLSYMNCAQGGNQGFIGLNFKRETLNLWPYYIRLRTTIRKLALHLLKTSYRTRQTDGGQALRGTRIDFLIRHRIDHAEIPKNLLGALFRFLSWVYQPPQLLFFFCPPD